MTRPASLGCVAVAACVLAGPALLSAQTALNWAADDGARVASLEATGTRLEGEHLVLWFPASLSRAEGEALVRRLDPAVLGLWRRVGVHPWQAVPKGRITYYLHDDAFVAHATGRSAVFIPMARVKDGRAPFLHEATHELLSSRVGAPPGGGGQGPRRPLWLTEGLPDYVTRLVADEVGLVEQGPFGMPRLSDVDAACAERARTADGATMLPSIGTGERPDVLFTTDRARFAPTFYACACSFTRYLVGLTSLDAVIALFGLSPADMATRLDSVAGRPLGEVRAAWLRTVVDNARPRPRER